MLKSIVNGVEHDIVSIPMKTRNLFDEATATYGKYINSEGVETVSATGETNHSDYISVHENTSYTLSATKPTYNNITSAISWYDENKTFITRISYAVPSNAGRFSWTADSPIDAAFAIINFTRYSNFDGENDMLNLGSTALPYEPYGYQNGWEIRDNQNKLIWGREDELQTTTGTLQFKGYSFPVKVKSLLGNTVQNGTPTPDNPIIPEFVGVRTENLLDTSTATLGKYINAQGVETNSTAPTPIQALNHTGYIEIQPNTNYTYHYKYTKGIANTIALCWFDTSKSLISRDTKNVNYLNIDYTLTATSPANAAFCIINFTGYLPNEGMQLSFNSGSTALPYEPYGYKIPFNNNGENLWADRGFSASAIELNYTHNISNNYGTTLSTTTGKEVIVTQSAYPTGTVGFQNGFFFIDVDFSKYEIGDKITISFDYICNEVHSAESQVTTTVYAGNYSNNVPCSLSSGNWRVSGRLTAVITIIADMRPYVEVRLCGNSITVKNVMLNLGSTALPYSPYLNKTTPIYLGQTQTVRNVYKYQITGQETITTYTSYSARNCFFVSMDKDILVSTIPTLADRYIATTDLQTFIYTDNCVQIVGHICRIHDGRFSEVNGAGGIREYLQQQYAAGTPVTVWYILATPETGIINEPLAKIGDYADELNSTNAEISIQTTTGQNILTVDTTLAPYDMTISGHIKQTYTYWGKIREDVRSGLAQTKFPVGTILYDNNDETTGRAFQVVAYDKHFDPSMTARGYTHSMTLCQLKLSGPWQFDTSEAFLYTTVEMQPETYKFKIPNYDTTYGGNKTYYFTSTVSVPVDSQIVLKWDYQKLPASVTAYAGPNPQTKTTAITGFNALTLTEWVEGESPEAIDLGTIKLANNDPDSAYGKLNHIHRARYGSNNYYQSGLRQLLNTDLAASNWWHPTTIFDRPYANRTTNGYLRSLNEDFINVLATPEITHIANNVFEYPSLDGRTFTLNTEYKINTDKVFLLSHTEVGLSSSPNIGTILDYYSTHNTDNDRIKYRIDNGNAYYWWFRTPYPTSASIFRICGTSGALSVGNAGPSNGVAPAHIIQ